MNYRQAISVVVWKDNTFLLVSSKAWPPNSWCFPQGGIEIGETHADAARREIEEELGTKDFFIVGKSTHEHTYEFPEDIKKKKGFDGQKQTIWFARLLTNEISLSEEVAQLDWFDREDIIATMRFAEQKETFAKVLAEWDVLRENNIF